MSIRFGEFCLDSERRELSRNDRPVHLTRKARQLLELLVSIRPKVLTKEEIYDVLWQKTVVEESNLSVLIAEIRSALDDDARAPVFIRTVHGIGYGFIAEAADERAPSRIRIRAGSREYELLDGENIVGRDHDALVRLNAPGISRRHARITVHDGRVTIEDLGSKNGTYVRGTRIDGAAELNDGDEIRISRELLVMLKPDPLRSTVTETS